jgi:hypothetical protein
MDESSGGRVAEGTIWHELDEMGLIEDSRKTLVSASLLGALHRVMQLRTRPCVDSARQARRAIGLDGPGVHGSTERSLRWRRRIDARRSPCSRQPEIWFAIKLGLKNL